MSDTGSKFFEKRETLNIKIENNVSAQNVFDIEMITSTWFFLMVRLNGSPELREFFAHEVYDDESKFWRIESTEYTKHFLCEGLIIHRVEKIEGDKTIKVKDIVITKEETNKRLSATKESELFEYEQSSDYVVSVIERWPGCGMVIPDNVKINLDANIVWPVLKTEVKTEDGKTEKVTIQNSSNRIKFSQEGDTVEEGYLLATSKYAQGNAKGTVSLKGAKVVGDITLQMPYTCASFDILTQIELGDGEDNLVLFTS